MATLAPDRDPVATLVSAIGGNSGHTALSAMKQKQSSENAAMLYDTMAKIAEPNGIALRRPVYNGDAIEFSEQIVEQLTDDKVGRWEELENDRIAYHWYETEKQGGFFKNDFKRVKHTHQIIRPRFHKFPYRGCMPAKPKQIHDSILAVPALKKAARVLTGTLTGQGSATAANWQEDTLLTKSAKSFLSGAKNAAIGAAAMAGSVSRSIQNGATEMSRAFAADPCIIIGNLVLIGWVEDES
jgi:hypothetical protein